MVLVALVTTIIEEKLTEQFYINVKLKFLFIKILVLLMFLNFELVLKLTMDLLTLIKLDKSPYKMKTL